MMTDKKIISWEKWKNPYRPFKKKDIDSLNGDSDVDILDNGNEDDNDSCHYASLVLYTPLGPVPVNENNDPEKIYNFWMGHTNFNISPRIKEIVRKVDGVEILNIYTRYRMRVGIGHMFDAEDVQRKINKALTQHFSEREVCGEKCEQEHDSGPSTGPEHQHSN